MHELYIMPGVANHDSRKEISFCWRLWQLGIAAIE